MLKKERHDSIMRQINLHNRVLTSDLVQLLNVSEDTIRRDLQELAEERNQPFRDWKIGSVPDNGPGTGHDTRMAVGYEREMTTKVKRR